MEEDELIQKRGRSSGHHLRNPRDGGVKKTRAKLRGEGMGDVPEVT